MKLYLPLDGQRLSVTGGTAFVSYGCQVDQRAFIGDGAILGRQCVLSAGASVQHSVLNDSCTLGRGCTVTHSVLDRGVTLEDGALCHNSVVGTGSKLIWSPRSAKIARRRSICLGLSLRIRMW